MTAYRVSDTSVHVLVEDGPAATGLTSGLRERTVHAKGLTISYRPDSTVRRIEITGPYERADGSLTATYATVMVDAEGDDDMRYRPAPQWVTEIVEAVRPA
jgi:hypothetical protein